MMDPRPKVSQVVDLTFLGVFSGYTNSHAMGHHTIPDYERELDMTKWLSNKVDDPDVMVGIGFSNISGTTVDPCDYEDLSATVPVPRGRRRSATHIIKPSSQIQRERADLQDKVIEKKIRKLADKCGKCDVPNGCCVNCGQPLQIPKMLAALYPRTYIAHGDIRYIVSKHNLCDYCARRQMIDALCGNDNDSYSEPYNFTYEYDNRTSITYHATVAYCDTIMAYTENSIIPIADYIEEHADRVSFHEGIAQLVSSEAIDSFGGILQKKRALYQKLSNRFYNSAYNNPTVTHAQTVKERLEALAKTIDDVWSTDVDGLKSALRVRTSANQPHVNIHKMIDYEPGVNLVSLSSGYSIINHYRCAEIVKWLAEMLDFELKMIHKSPTLIATTGDDYTNYITNNRWTTVSTMSTSNNITFSPNTNRYNTTITLVNTTYDDTQIPI